MVSIDNDRCSNCGICYELYGGYCIALKDDKIEIDYSVCNECQKCIAVCPMMAFSNNGKPPRRIEKPIDIKPEQFEELLQRRRSIKNFKKTKIPKEVLGNLARIAQYAPTMNKKIEMIIIDDEDMIKLIDEAAMSYVRKYYNILFNRKIVLKFCQIFSDTLPIIKRKMERDLFNRGQVIKNNTPALMLLLGDTRIPLSESSAQYYMANMILYAQLIGLGSCPMDSLKLAINHNKKVKDRLKIPRNFKVLGVLAVGYPHERILNVPEGYKMNVGWNSRNNTNG